MLSVAMLSVVLINFDTLSVILHNVVTIFDSGYAECRHAECLSAECRVIVMLCDMMLRVAMLFVAMLSVTLLSVGFSLLR